MSQEALICGEVSYHEYNGILVDQEERDALQRHLGPNNKVSRTEGVMQQPYGGSLRYKKNYLRDFVLSSNTIVHLSK